MPDEPEGEWCLICDAYGDHETKGHVDAVGVLARAMYRDYHRDRFAPSTYSEVLRWRAVAQAGLHALKSIPEEKRAEVLDLVQYDRSCEGHWHFAIHAEVVE